MEWLLWPVEFVRWFVDIIVHFDLHIHEWVQAAGSSIYTVCFIIILLETGVVLCPFLPGDSLLFALGAIAAANPDSVLKTEWLIPCLAIAAIVGGAINYYTGLYAGPRVFKSETSLWFNKNHLIKTQGFYEKHGSKALVFARFIPIFRTFVPFIAGIGQMKSNRFHSYNIIGAILWVFFMTGMGHFFGNIPVVKKNFGAVVPAIIVISALPVIIELVKKRGLKKAKIKPDS